MFTETVNVIGSPGNTTPLDGVTDIQGALATAALNVIGPPVVDSVTVCVAGTSGGVVKLIDGAQHQRRQRLHHRQCHRDGYRAREPRGRNLDRDRINPIASPLGFTSTLIAAGSSSLTRSR